MARRRVSIDEKIELAKTVVEKAKSKYDAAVDVLEKLMTIRQNLQKEELMQAVLKSNKSFKEIMDFLNKNS